jgi:hypothetical protein
VTPPGADRHIATSPPAHAEASDGDRADPSAGGGGEVRFIPSQVEGLSGVTEAAVFPDRLELKSHGGWVTFPFASFGWPQESRTAARIKRMLKLKPARRIVGEIWFDPVHYPNSYVRFFTEPRLTIYMPATGPTRYPHSHFWRIQQTVRAGGCEVEDYDPESAFYAPRPRWARVVGYTLVGLGFANFLSFVAAAQYLGGDAGRGKVDGGRYLLGYKGRYTEVSREVWTYSYWHNVSVTVTHAGMFVGVCIAAHGFRRVPRGVRP